MLTVINARLVIRLGVAISLCISAWASEPNVLKVTFNGLDIFIDRETGSFLQLTSSSTGVILKTPPETAGLVDLAYPIESFTPMRLTSRFSRAEVAQEKNQVVITWKSLGASRSNFTLPEGRVYAQVTIWPADDRRSIIMTCRVENQSTIPVPQVLFPDLWGLQSFAGTEETQLRLARGVEQPFKKPIKQDHGWQVYSPAGYYGENALRWLDFGSLEGGLSIFQKKWGSADFPELVTRRSEQDPLSLRLAWEHKQTIEAGHTWESGEFWFTPHPGGWAKGIEVYRRYVAEVSPPRPLPTHVRDGLGFQTIFLTQPQERDSAKAYFRFADLPQVAQDAAQHGIDEVVFWYFCSYFAMPIPFRPGLGTREELVESIRKAKELGVNMVPFVSVHEALAGDAKHFYGVNPSATNHLRNWEFHSELIPNSRPYYVKGYDTIWVPSDNPLWLKNVGEVFTDWIDGGTYSFSFDEFGEIRFDEYGADKYDFNKTELMNLAQKVRDLTRAKDPESTFSGESINADSFEVDGKVLDYTWNWVNYVDAGPILNVLRVPRLNCNVEDSALIVKRAFSDGLYLNVMPRRPDESYGSAFISNQPDMAKALKEVASLRKQFLPFFVEGTFIGESVLSKRTSASVQGYTLHKKLLMIVLNDQAKAGKVTVSSDLTLWLPSTQSYVSQYYNSAGKLVRTAHSTGQQWSGSTDLLQPHELSLYEIDGK